MTTPTATLVTCSYAPDYQRCRRLCATVSRYVSLDIPHLIIVPRHDLDIFAPLADRRTRVVAVQSLMPPGTLQLPFQRRWWVSPGCLPIRGWIMQQVTKIASAELVETDAMIFIDSDVTFVRPFGTKQIMREGRVRLHRVPNAADTPSHHRWHRQAGLLLGIEQADYYGSDYIAQLVCWRKQTVLDMCRRIEQVHHRSWRRVLFNTLHFSEYILYGVFVEHVRSLEAAGHWADPDDLCLSSWHHHLANASGREKFLASLTPRQVAVLVQSNLNLDQKDADKLVGELIDRHNLDNTRSAIA